jgi:hypothetical protein
VTFPPPDASGVNGQTIFVRLLAVIVIVPFRVLIGVAVAYTLVRVIDVGLFRRPNDK